MAEGSKGGGRVKERSRRKGDIEGKVRRDALSTGEKKRDGRDGKKR